MTAPLRSLFRYANRLRQWVRPDGQPIADSAILSEMRVHQVAPDDELTSLTGQLYGGQISLARWQIAVGSTLKDAHLAQAMYAIGGQVNLTPEVLQRVRDTLRKEYTFLNQFAADVAAGRISEAQALARIRQYGKATQQSYWNEIGRRSGVLIYWDLYPAEHCGDCIDLAAGSPYTADTLPTTPGAGDTECRGNCQCGLRTEAIA